MLSKAKLVFTNFFAKLYYILCYRSITEIKILSVIYWLLRMLSRFEEGFIANAFCSVVQDAIFWTYVCILSFPYYVTHINIRTNELIRGKLNLKCSVLLWRLCETCEVNFLLVSWEARGVVWIYFVFTDLYFPFFLLL